MQFLVPQNALSMHVCKFSQGDVCDVNNKYTLEVHVNNLGNEAALIVYGCTFSVKCLVESKRTMLTWHRKLHGASFRVVC